MRPLDPTPSLQPHYGPSSLLRVGPPRCSASIRSPRGFRRLGFSLRIGATGSCSSTRQPASASRPSTPIAVRSVIRHPADLSQLNHTLLVSTTLEFLTPRLRRVHFRSSLGCSPARVFSEILPRLPKLTVKKIRLAIGVSHPYATLIRAGLSIPHPRHWLPLAELMGI
jgi:hypothetical protein